MKIYRITSEVKRPHYGHYKVGGTTTKITGERGMRMVINSTGANTRPVKIEEAEVGEFTDVTEEYL